MIPIYDFATIDRSAILNRDIRAEEDVNAAVDAILADVKANGDAALRKYTAKFDGASVSELAVSEEEIDAAVASCDPYFLETLRQVAENIRAFHEKQVHNNFDMTRADGVLMGQRYTPIEKAGVYVPGGTASYLSTVLMDVIPAKIAGVSEIVMMTPPRKDGSLAPDLLAAAKIAGVTRIFKSGGAQASAPSPTARRASPLWIKSWAPATFLWLWQNVRCSALYPSI